MPVFLVYFALLAVAFFFLIVRPQRRQLAARRALIQAVEVGDEIITAGGIYGRGALDRRGHDAGGGRAGCRADPGPRGRGPPARRRRALDERRRPTTRTTDADPTPRRRRTDTVRRSFWYLTITVVLIVGTFTLTLAQRVEPGPRPRPPGRHRGAARSQVGKQRPTAVLDKAVDIIRNRVNGLGVAETEVKRDGDQIVVDLPGVKDRDKARRLVGKTAELRFRPVLAGSRARARSPPTSRARRRRRPPPRPRRRTADVRRRRRPADRARASARARPATRRTTRPAPPTSTSAATTATTAATTATTAAAATTDDGDARPAIPPLTTPARGQAQRDRRAVRPRRQDRGTSSGRPRSPAGPSTPPPPGSTAAAAAAGSSCCPSTASARRSSTSSRPTSYPQVAAAERGGDRARRRGAVGARVPDAELHRRRRDLGQLQPGRRRGPRDGAASSVRCRCS